MPSKIKKRNIRNFHAIFYLNSGSSPRLKDSMHSPGFCFYASFPWLLLTWMDYTDSGIFEFLNLNYKDFNSLIFLNINIVTNIPPTIS